MNENKKFDLMLNGIIKVSLSLVLGLFLWACGGKKEENAATKAVEKAVLLESDKVVGLARIEPAGKMVQLFSEVNGIVKEIKVSAGQQVSKGAAIVQLADEVEKSQLAQAQSKISTQNAQIAVQIANIKTREVNIKNARLLVERISRMVEKGAQTQQSLDDAKTNLETQLSDLQSAQASLKQNQQKLEELQTDINYYQTLLNRRTVKAPNDGTVLSVDILPGNLLTNTTVIGDFAPAGKPLAVVEIDEMFAENIQTGQNAIIRKQGTTEEVAKGKVIFIAPYLKKKSLFSDQVGSQEDRRIREVRIELEGGEKLLIGSRVEAVISTK